MAAVGRRPVAGRHRPDAGAALALVGGVNGTATVYDLANPTAKGREFEGKHDGGVAAAAFCPDGRFCVTADEQAIYMYEAATGKRKYAFPAASITARSPRSASRRRAGGFGRARAVGPRLDGRTRTARGRAPDRLPFRRRSHPSA